MRKTDLTIVHARRRRVVGGGLLLAAAAAVTSAGLDPAVAADPTARPAATAPTTATGDHRGRPGGYGGRMAMTGTGPQWTDAERNDALAFMKEHAPVRYKAMQAIVKPQEKNAVETYAIRAIVPLRRSERDDPELYKTTVHRMEVEDRVFDLAGQVHRAAAGTDVTDLRKQLRDQVSADVDVRLAEQRLRLESLRQTVEKEQQRLDRDLARRDKLVDEQFDRLLVDDFRQPFQGGGRRNRNNADGDGTRPVAP